MNYPVGRERSARAVTAGAVLATAGGLYLVNPNTTHVPLCPLHAMTGLWCPLCGSTRAAYGLLHGDLAQALRDNLLFVVASPVALTLLAMWLAGRARAPVSPKLYWASAVVLIAFGVLRNLPSGSWLAPPA